MERSVLSFGQAREFADKHLTKLTAAVGGGGFVSDTFLSGRAERAAAIAGGVAATYTIVKIWRHFMGTPGEEPQEQNNNAYNQED